MYFTLRTSVIAVALASSAALGQPAFGQAANEQLGAVRFETSCSPEAQKLFDKAMLYQHSFWYRASQRTFEDALKKDPECAIAYWGIALSLLWNPHLPPPAKNLADGVAVLAKGKSIGAKTQRERDYLDALLVMYADYDKIDHRTRNVAYAKAMEQLALRYPDDDEAAIHYALALNTSASPADKTYANQLKGGALLEPIFQRQPNHPGVAHYLIHLYDYPAIADKGLDAARRYAKIAPAAAHAQHMPSHIFTRLGYWDDSIASNVESARVAKEDGEAGDQLHAMDYLVYANLQLGQDRKAKAVIDEMLASQGLPRGLSGRTVCAGRFAGSICHRTRRLEDGGNARGPPESASPGTGDHPLARALGAARLGEIEAAKADIAKLVELRDKLRDAKDAYWSEQVDIQRQVAAAWVLYAEGNHEGALAAMNAAADAEDKTGEASRHAGCPEASARALRRDAARAWKGRRKRWSLSRRRSRRSPTGSAPISERRRLPRRPAIRQKRSSTSPR